MCTQHRKHPDRNQVEDRVVLVLMETVHEKHHPCEPQEVGQKNSLVGPLGAPQGSWFVGPLLGQLRVSLFDQGLLFELILLH
jgi:hypothetical protein